jgi:predicted tellurium resistance membrane protein TerC
MDSILTFENLVKFSTLSGLEIVLGIDNIIFIALIVYNIPKPKRMKIRFFGITLAIALRILMLFSISWIMGLTKTLFSFHGMDFSGRSLLLISGGLFLIVKAGIELAQMLKIDAGVIHGSEHERYHAKQDLNIILQIIFVDLVLSFDSVIVAVGMVSQLYLIIPAILVAMVVMLVSAEAIGQFLHSNPNIKVLGLAFILLVGVALFLGGFGLEVPKSHLYMAMFFSLFVELINIRARKIRAGGEPAITQAKKRRS